MTKIYKGFEFRMFEDDASVWKILSNRKMKDLSFETMKITIFSLA